MSIFDVLTWGRRAAGAAARGTVVVGGIEKNQVARMPAPEMTAVDFQSMLEKITAILTFRSLAPRAIPATLLRASAQCKCSLGEHFSVGVEPRDLRCRSVQHAIIRRALCRIS
jgi:hypothetical protein